MGQVYLATDLETSQRVALKVLHQGLDDAARFEREAQVLRALSHDAIVRYVAHGVTEEGRPFIAMEWLDGEDLGRRLARGPISVEETLGLVRRIAEGLAVVHRAGLVHRDIKPDNVFLPSGMLISAKIVDFGLARPPRSQILTAQGILVGTPGYMAPEQIKGESPTPAVDIFALGCVAYHCLTGQAPFPGKNAVAVLTKVLIEDPAPLATACPGAPPALIELVSRLMAKKAPTRPADGSAAIAAVDALVTAPAARRAKHLSGVERMLAAVLVVAWLHTRFDHYDATVAQIASEFGGRVEASIGHGAVITFSRARGAEEQAVAATRAALRMAWMPGVRASLALVATDGSLTQAIERAATSPTSWPRGSVLIDETTERLLPSRFERVSLGEHFAVVSEREGLDLPRTVLGRVTPFVGRTEPLEALVSHTAGALSNRRSTALIVEGEPGMGKSRLRAEALRVLAGRIPELSVLAARGDDRSRAVPMGTFGGLVRRLAGATSVDPVVDRARLAARVGRSVHPAERAARIARFLGEAAGLASPEDDPELRAARADRSLMSENVRSAFADFVAAETFRGPVLLIVEDAHVADPSSIGFLPTLLDRLERAPFVVWLVSRPPTDVLSVALGSRVAERITLGPLPASAVHALLSSLVEEDPRIPAAVVSVVSAGGSPLLVEEAARSLAERTHAEQPGRIGGVAQVMVARISTLAPELRAVLRAGAIVGESFWVPLVAELLGEDASQAVDVACDELIRREWLVERPQSRFHGEREVGFVSESARTAAESLLVAADRKRGHEICARYLEQKSDVDALVIADHFAKAGLMAEAVPHWLRAAERALTFSDVRAALELLERALGHARTPELEGGILTLKAEALRIRGDYAAALEVAERALATLGSLGGTRPARWFEAVGEVVTMASRLRRLDLLAKYAEALRGELRSDPSGAQVIATARAAMLLEHAGITVRARPLYEWLDSVEALFNQDPLVCGRLLFARAWRQQSTGDYFAYFSTIKQAIKRFEQSGDVRTTAQMEANAAFACLELGDYAQAAELGRSALTRSRSTGAPAAIAIAQNNLGMALARLGEHKEALELERAAALAYEKLGDVRLEGASRIYLARILALSGSLSESEQEARRAVSLLETVPLMLPHALAVLSATLLARGKSVDGLVAAQRAADVYATAGDTEGSAVPIHLALVESLIANGELDEARLALSRASEALSRAASNISDASARARFETLVPEHARVRTLERELVRPTS